LTAVRIVTHARTRPAALARVPRLVSERAA